MTQTLAKTEAGKLTLKLVTSGDTKNTVIVKATKRKLTTSAEGPVHYVPMFISVIKNISIINKKIHCIL